MAGRSLGVATSKADIDEGVITGVTIDNSVIGGTTAAAGTFSTLTATTLVATTLTVSGLTSMSRAALAATGSGASTAALIGTQVVAVTDSDGTKAVALPTAATTTGPILVINTVTTAALPVYPVNGGNDNINAGSEDAAWTLGPGKAAWFIPTSATQWYTDDASAIATTTTEANILDGVTATAAEINMAADISANNELVLTTNSIAAAESGSTYFLDAAAEFVSTLPAPALGLRFTFIVKTAPASASYTIVTAGGAVANIIKGCAVNAEGVAGDTGTADDTITFVDGQAVAGDRVDVYSDGTSWFAYAICKVAAGVTFTQASA